MSNPELAFIPWEGMGHLVPMVELAKLMLQRNQSLSISILVMRTSMDFGADKYLDSVTSDSGHPRLRFLDLRQYNDPDAGEVELNPDNFLFDFIDKQTANVRRFAQTNYADECDRPRLVGFVIDMFCVPMIDVANEFGVPTYLFFASGIGFLGLSLHFQALKHDHEEDTSRYKNSDEELSIPCYANPVPAKALPAPMVEKNPGTDMFFDGVKRYKETKGIMVNTFADLEHYALQALSDAKTVPPIYPVGPLLNLEAGHGRNKPSQSESIIKWLDDQPVSSVVFLFAIGGSETNFEWLKALAQEVHCAYGVQPSNVLISKYGPSNVLISKYGRVVLVGFDSARIVEDCMKPINYLGPCPKKSSQRHPLNEGMKYWSPECIQYCSELSRRSAEDLSSKIGWGQSGQNICYLILLSRSVGDVPICNAFQQTLQHLISLANWIPFINAHASATSMRQLPMVCERPMIQSPSSFLAIPPQEAFPVWGLQLPSTLIFTHPGGGLAHLKILQVLPVGFAMGPFKRSNAVFTSATFV
nr:anthocyanidin 3-O-glucosyltransferase 2-like [Ipomoea batatas]GME16253.1 anthocyanidin 3-O-glucosyltransferase 2-like [Ipomoea batatas]